MIVIRSLENTGALVNGTTRKINIEKGGLLNFFFFINKSCFTMNQKCTYIIS